MNDPMPVRRRKATNVSLDVELVEEARAFDVNLSRACEAGLAQATKAAREKAWLAENLAAIHAWNDWIEENGMPFAEYRQF